MKSKSFLFVALIMGCLFMTSCTDGEMSKENSGKEWFHVYHSAEEVLDDEAFIRNSSNPVLYEIEEIPLTEEVSVPAQSELF